MESSTHLPRQLGPSMHHPPPELSFRPVASVKAASRAIDAKCASKFIENPQRQYVGIILVNGGHSGLDDDEERELHP